MYITIQIWRNGIIIRKYWTKSRPKYRRKRRSIYVCYFGIRLFCASTQIQLLGWFHALCAAVLFQLPIRLWNHQNFGICNRNQASLPLLYMMAFHSFPCHILPGLNWSLKEWRTMLWPIYSCIFAMWMRLKILLPAWNGAWSLEPLFSRLGAVAL